MLKEPNLAKEAGQGLLGIVSSYARGDLGSMASTAMSFFKKATNGDEVYQRNLRTKTSSYVVTALAKALLTISVRM